MNGHNEDILKYKNELQTLLNVNI